MVLDLNQLVELTTLLDNARRETTNENCRYFCKTTEEVEINKVIQRHAHGRRFLGINPETKAIGCTKCL